MTEGVLPTRTTEWKESNESNESKESKEMENADLLDSSLITQAPSLSPMAIDFLLVCWKKDPKLRPSPSELLSHEFLNQIL